MKLFAITKLFNRVIRSDVLVSIFIIIFSLLLQICWLPEKELWLDETHSALLSEKRFLEMFEFVKGDVHPPLYFILLWLWTNALGHGPIILKSFSVFTTTVANLLFLYLTRCNGLTKFTGIAVTTLFAFSPVLFWYSVEARMYSLLVLISIFILIFIEKINKKSHIRNHYTYLLGLTLALLFYTHYTAMFFIFGLFIWWLIFYKIKQLDLKCIFSIGLIFLVLTSPWYLTLNKQISSKSFLSSAHQVALEDSNTIHYFDKIPKSSSSLTSIDKIIENLASIAGIYPSKIFYYQLFYTIPFVVTFFVICILAWKKEGTIWLTIFIGASLITGALIFNLNDRRYLILITPLIVFSIGKSLDYLSNKKQILALVTSSALMVSSAIGVYRIIDTHYVKLVTNIVNTIKSSNNEGEFILIQSMHGQVPIDYYLKLAKMPIKTTGFPISIYDWWANQKFKGWGSPIVSTNDLNVFISNLSANKPRKFWYIMYEVENYDRMHNLKQLLIQKAKNFNKVEIIDNSKKSIKYQLFYVEI